MALMSWPISLVLVQLVTEKECQAANYRTTGPPRQTGWGLDCSLMVLQSIEHNLVHFLHCDRQTVVFSVFEVLR